VCCVCTCWMHWQLYLYCLALHLLVLVLALVGRVIPQLYVLWDEPTQMRYLCCEHMPVLSLLISVHVCVLAILVCLRGSVDI
jgi:hypothetical protein